MNTYSYDNEDESSKDSDSVAQISEHDLAWQLINSDTDTGEVLIWEYAQEYNISEDEVKRQLRRFANSEKKDL